MIHYQEYCFGCPAQWAFALLVARLCVVIMSILQALIQDSKFQRLRPTKGLKVRHQDHDQKKNTEVEDREPRLHENSVSRRLEETKSR